jgi:hypothetical protein
MVTIARPIGIKSRLIEGITTKRRDLLDKYFYFFMSLLIAVVVAYGFSRTVDQSLLHALPRPFVFYLHAAAFYGIDA